MHEFKLGSAASLKQTRNSLKYTEIAWNSPEIAWNRPEIAWNTPEIAVYITTSIILLQNVLQNVLRIYYKYTTNILQIYYKCTTNADVSVRQED